MKIFNLQYFYKSAMLNSVTEFSTADL